MLDLTERDLPLWRAAVDEAGHVIAGRKLGIKILSAVVDPNEVCETVPDWNTVPNLEVAAKFRLAGLAAMIALNCVMPQDAEQPDFVSTKQHIAEKLEALGLSAQAAAIQSERDIRRMLNEVRDILSDSSTMCALQRCALHIYQHHCLQGGDADEVINSFFRE